MIGCTPMEDGEVKNIDRLSVRHNRNKNIDLSRDFNDPVRWRNTTGYAYRHGT